MNFKQEFCIKSQRMEKIIHMLACRYYAYMGETSWNRECQANLGKLISFGNSDPTSMTFGKADIDLHLEAYYMELKLIDLMKTLIGFNIINLSQYRTMLRQYRGCKKTNNSFMLN